MGWHAGETSALRQEERTSGTRLYVCVPRVFDPCSVVCVFVWCGMCRAVMSHPVRCPVTHGLVPHSLGRLPLHHLAAVRFFRRLLPHQPLAVATTTAATARLHPLAVMVTRHCHQRRCQAYQIPCWRIHNLALCWRRMLRRRLQRQVPVALRASPPVVTATCRRQRLTVTTTFRCSGF